MATCRKCGQGKLRKSSYFGGRYTCKHCGPQPIPPALDPAFNKPTVNEEKTND